MSSISAAGSSTATYYQPLQASAAASANRQPVPDPTSETVNTANKLSAVSTTRDGNPGDSEGGFDATV